MTGQRYDIPLGVGEVPNVDLQIEDAQNLSLGVNEEIVISKDYNGLRNKPQINSVTLQGNKTFDELGLGALSNMEIFEILR